MILFCQFTNTLQLFFYYRKFLWNQVFRLLTERIRKRSASVAPEVNLRDMCREQMKKEHASESRLEVTNSPKYGYQWLHKKNLLIFSKIEKWKRNMFLEPKNITSK